MSRKKRYMKRIFDPAVGAWTGRRCLLRTFQSDALRNIYDAALAGEGGRFVVMFPRQSGKNETQAQLEAALMGASQHHGGNIIKIIPTEKNQGKVSTERLSSVLSAQSAGEKAPAPAPTPAQLQKTKAAKSKKDEVSYGSTRVRCLSASPNSAIVGATADLLLEVDEAQMVDSAKFDREASPMAAANNAVQVFWGTAWDDQTLLSRETRLARQEEDGDSRRHVFVTTAAEVGQEVPEYDRFVSEQIEHLGREHPAVRTQFFCEEISELTAMFTPERICRMQGEHAALSLPDPGRCYVFLIDVAGSDEIRAKDRKAHGFSDRRDATVVTICEVSLPADKRHDPRNFVWRTVGRRLYRNLPGEKLEQEICREISLWEPRKIIVDHSGLGVMLSDLLFGKYGSRVQPVDITAAGKTKMAWDFLAMVDSGRWIEHRGDAVRILRSSFTPGVEKFEILKEPDLLQQMFYRELRACRIEPTGNPSLVRWGVKEGTRDHATSRVLHDDLVMSAAMAVFENGTLSVRSSLSDPEWDLHYEGIRRMVDERNSSI